MKIILLFLLALSFPLKTFSNVIITGTRVIYPEAADSMVIQLTNNSTSPSLIQSWIDSGDINSTPENSNKLKINQTFELFEVRFSHLNCF